MFGKVSIAVRDLRNHLVILSSQHTNPSEFVAIISVSHVWIDFKFGMLLNIYENYIVSSFGCCLISTSVTSVSIPVVTTNLIY